jgi:hypothetical protein
LTLVWGGFLSQFFLKIQSETNDNIFFSKSWYIRQPSLFTNKSDQLILSINLLNIINMLPMISRTIAVIYKTKFTMNQLVLVVLLLCVSAALIPTEVQGFFKTGREVRERMAANKQRETYKEYNYSDDERRAFLDALMRKVQEESGKRNKLD